MTGKGLQDLIRVEDRFYILASSSRVDDRTRVLKHGDTFAVLDRFGDIAPVGLGELGLYHQDTRFLSRFELELGGERPLILSSTIKDDNTLLAVDLTNPDYRRGDGLVVARGSLHLSRERLLWGGVCYERLRLANYGGESIDAALEFYVDADFADIFQVRGVKRESEGRRLEPAAGEGQIVLGYEGRDGVVRRTRIAFAPHPSAISGSGARFDLHLESRRRVEFLLTISCEVGEERPRIVSHDESSSQAVGELRAARARDCQLETSNEQFNDWVNRSLADLHMMVSETPQGAYPYAGVPWFSTPFGRDGIITALEFLWVNPEVARGVLSYLAATQARTTNPEQDAQPGKILHETRKGEMAALGEVPFARYYGSVDATPLFVLLAGAYFERTGDRDLIGALWPSIERALAWVEGDGDPDGDGFVEYARRTPKGLVHQGWKDSGDSVFHADGTLAEGPIALCEVQGYAYAARLAAAGIAAELGRAETAAKLTRDAETLRERFERAFWCEDLSTYALGLDGAKRPCGVRSSNPGHCLFTGICSPERAKRVMHNLLSPAAFSGWGVRTVAAGEARYNPMSYHDGSVWPHDNALIGAGLGRYGFRDGALKILAGLFDVSLFVDQHRLPELFCGFDRRPGEGPTLYPVACSPQAWATGAPFMLLQACLGLSIDGAGSRVCFRQPALPPFLEVVRLRHLRAGEASVDLVIERHEHDVGINVLRRSGALEVVVVK